ncbi:MAG: hypothetical protein AAGG69_02870 [Pseudomonadota bacterium]
MTQQEQALVDDKMRAEIAKLLADTRYVDDRSQAEIAKFHAEATQLKMSAFLAPFLAAAGLMGATAALVKLFFT